MNLFSFKTSQPPQHLAKGLQAEKLAEKFLQGKGLKTIINNFSIKGGEIDSIMLHHDTLVFVEVRLREHQQVTAAESVSIHKQRRIIKAAKMFILKHNKYQQLPCRFDVVALDKLDCNHIDWIQDAFQVQESF